MFSSRLAILLNKICFFVIVFPVTFLYICWAKLMASSSHFVGGRLASVMAICILLSFTGTILRTSFNTPISFVSPGGAVFSKIGFSSLNCGGLMMLCDVHFIFDMDFLWFISISLAISIKADRIWFIRIFLSLNSI